MMRLRWFGYFLLLTGLLWVIVTPAMHVSAQEDTPVPVTTYWQTLHEIEQSLDELTTAAPETQRSQLAAAAIHLQTITAVTLPDGAVQPIDHTVLIQELQTDPPDIPRLQALLTTWLAVSQEWPNGRFTASDQDSLAPILVQPEFHYDNEPGRLQQWWQDIVDRLTRFLERITPNISGGTARLLNWLLSVVGAVLLGVILAYMLQGFLLDMVNEARLSPDLHDEAESLTAETALQKAQTLSGTGDYRSAVRYLYLSSLLLLEEHGLLRYDRSQTNREYLRSVSHKPQLAVILQDVVDVFDRVWYGFQPIGQQEYQHYEAQVEALKRLR